MIAVAAPDTQRRAKAGKLGDTIGQRVGGAGDEITGDYSEIRGQAVGHVYGAADLFAGHVAAEMNVAELDDAQPFKRGREVGEGNGNFADLIAQAFAGKTVERADKWDGACEDRSRLEKIAAREVGRDAFGNGRGSRLIDGSCWGACRAAGRSAVEALGGAPEPFASGDELHGNVGEEGAGEPQAGESGNQRPARHQVALPHAQPVCRREDDQEKRRNPGASECPAQNAAGYAPGQTPRRTIPKPLRKKQDDQDRQKNNNANENPAPVQIQCVSFRMLHKSVACGGTQAEIPVPGESFQQRE